MSDIRVNLHVTFRWWAKPALYCATFIAVARGKDVSEKFIDFIVDRGMRLEIVE